MKNNKTGAIICAVSAAVFYAINMPFSKLLLNNVEPTFMASFLYFGAGIGIGAIYLISGKYKVNENKLTKKDLPYTIGMILLDTAAPIFLMFGLLNASSANASLLNNFETVATSVIALMVFKEVISKRLWGAIFLITLSSTILSFDGMESFKFSYGSIFILTAAVCWGFENNCTRKISSKSTYEIVILKGIFSGLGSFLIALIKSENFPHFKYIAAVLILGFIAYGLSIFLYVRSQNTLGAAKTSAYYAISPFIGALLSFVILREAITANYVIALIIMIIGSALVVTDTIILKHTHLHTHTIVHTHNGSTHTHITEHAHEHSHYVNTEKHTHYHNYTADHN